MNFENTLNNKINFNDLESAIQKGFNPCLIDVSKLPGLNQYQITNSDYRDFRESHNMGGDSGYILMLLK